MRTMGIAVLAAALFLGCGGQASDRTPVPASWIGEIAAIGEDGHGGFATASILRPGVTRVNVTLSGGSVGGRHPWHVHTGTCGSGGEIVADATAYPILEPNARGNASATATLDIELDPEADYHVNLHASPDDLGTLVGCGDLIRS